MELKNTSFVTPHVETEKAPKTPPPVDEARARLERIRELERAQNGNGVWNMEKWKELKSLREQDPAAKKTITPEMASALHRQGTAGHSGQPDLKVSERKLIVQANLILQAKRKN